MRPRRGAAPWAIRFRSLPRTVAAGVVLSASLAIPLSAQSGEWPTLSGAGLEYLSESGLFQLSLSGQLDLEALHMSDSWTGLAWRTQRDQPLPDARVPCTSCHVGMGFRGDGGVVQAHRLRVFADIFVGDRFYSLIEFRSDRGHTPSDRPVETRIEQAYARVANRAGTFGVQAGRFASPFGSYPMRHLTTVDPFIRPPLAHDYRTLMSRTLVPRDAAILLDWRHATEFLRKPGATPIWDVPYQWGAMAFGRVGPLDLRFAAMNSAPSSRPASWSLDLEQFENPSWVAGARLRASPSLELGFSYHRGPWLEEPIAGTIQLPAGASPGAQPRSYQDFDQELLSADVAFARGATMLRAEAILDRWEVPNVADRPSERIYSVEAQRDLIAGLFTALRFGYVDFRPLSDELGAASPLPGGREDWDFDVSRYEASLGYRLARNVGVLFSALEQRRKAAASETLEEGGARDGDGRLLGLRLWWAF